MVKQKIAILTDSGSDVPYDIAKEMNIFVVPLQVNYKDKSYRDGVDIDADTMYKRLKEEIPTTSLPLGQDIDHVISQIEAQGYTHILAVVLSSGLSGTCNLLKLVAKESKLPMEVIDTKNIGIGSGLSVIKAAKYVQEGLSWEELQVKVQETILKTRVFFVLDTLEYLQKGGRIGKVTALIGYALDLRPIITCDKDGIYTTIAKARGRKVSINRCMEIALDFVKDCANPTLALAHGNALEETLKIKENIVHKLEGKGTIYIGQVSPALGVHTGPGLIGIGVQID
ncbi:MAG TPA: DegV family protein [Erysipelotrichaceae bacterium]|nr:DegV family protein [Erysipelotrichaceae bacterium]